MVSSGRATDRTSSIERIVKSEISTRVSNLDENPNENRDANPKRDAVRAQSKSCDQR